MKQRSACIGSTFVMVSGKVEKEREVIHVLARTVKAFGLRDAKLETQSRDFH